MVTSCVIKMRELYLTVADPCVFVWSWTTAGSQELPPGFDNGKCSFLCLGTTLQCDSVASRSMDWAKDCWCNLCSLNHSSILLHLHDMVSNLRSKASLAEVLKTKKSWISRKLVKWREGLMMMNWIPVLAVAAVLRGCCTCLPFMSQWHLNSEAFQNIKRDNSYYQPVVYHVGADMKIILVSNSTRTWAILKQS